MSTFELQCRFILSSKQVCCVSYSYFALGRFFEAHSGELHEPLPSAPCLDVAPLRVVAAAQRSKELGTAAKVSSEDAWRPTPYIYISYYIVYHIIPYYIICLLYPLQIDRINDFTHFTPRTRRRSSGSCHPWSSSFNRRCPL